MKYVRIFESFAEHSELEKLVRDFKQDVSPEECDYNFCIDASEKLSKYLFSRGIDNKVLIGENPHAKFPDSWYHSVVAVGNNVIDLTYGQFDDTYDENNNFTTRIYPLHEFLDKFSVPRSKQYVYDNL